MKILLNQICFFYFIMLSLLFFENVNAQCIITGATVNTSTYSPNPCVSLTGCNGILYVGNGVTATSLVMNSALDLSCLGVIQLIVRDKASIDFSPGNFRLTLAAGSSISFEGKGTLVGGSCNASERIYIGTDLIASCNGGAGADYSFAELVASGGFNIVNISPSSASVCGSGSFSFTATAIPSSGATIKWYSAATGGTLLGSSSTYTTSSISTTTTYYAEATIGAFTTPRKAVVATVNALPTITTQPITQLDCEGASVKFKVTATGTGLTYTWQRKKPTDASFITIPVEGNISYPSAGEIKVDNVGSSQSPSGTQYQVVVTNSNGCSLTSSAATLLVNEITNVTGSATVTQCYGTNYSYTVTTSTPSPGYVVSYQWKSSVVSGVWNNIVDGTHFSGATTATLNIINGRPAESAEYRVYVVFHSSGADCNVNSSTRSRTITFLPQLTSPVTTIIQPSCVTATGTITVTVQSATDTYSFDNGVTFQSSNVKSGLSSGSYNVIIKNIGGCTSVIAPTVINAQPTTPVAPTVGTITQPTCALATGSVVLSGLPSGNWTINPGGIAGSTSSTTVSGLAIGTHNFTVTNASGCTSPASANVVISPLITKTWNGAAWSPLGVPTNNNLVVINGNYNTTSNGDLNACSLVINSSYTLTITAGKNVIIQNDLTVNGVLEVLDQGSLVMVNDPGTVTNNGTTNIHRFTTPFKLFDYIYWSTPVVSTSIATTFLSKGWRTDHAYEYSPSGNWSFATTMTPGNGCVIMVPAPTTAPGGNVSEVVFSGKVNNGIQKITGVIPDSFYLLGNPYPSALDAEAFLDYNSGVLDGTLYFWTHNTAIQAANPSDTTLGSGGLAFTSNDYASYNSLGSVAVGLGETAGGVIAVSGGAKPTGKIASGQGFFASSNVTILGSNEIVFKNSMRLVGSTLGDGTGVNQQFFRTKSPKSKTVNAVEKSRIWLNLTNTQGAFKQTLVGYITGATNGYEGRFDGESFDGNEFVDFYSVNQDKNLVIQGRALPFDENDEVPLGFKSTISGDFTINIDQVDGSLINQAVYIEDRLVHTTVDLKTSPYTFATAAGIFNDRFVLKYSNKTLGTTKFDIAANKVLVSINNKQIKINSFAETIDKVAIYDLLGKQIYQKNKVNSTEWSVSDLVSSHQTVIIKTTLENGATLTDKIVF